MVRTTFMSKLQCPTMERKDASGKLQICTSHTHQIFQLLASRQSSPCAKSSPYVAPWGSWSPDCPTLGEDTTGLLLVNNDPFGTPWWAFCV